jgi:hypothetical protein
LLESAPKGLNPADVKHDLEKVDKAFLDSTYNVDLLL